MRSVAGVGAGSKSAATFAFTSTSPGLSSRTSLPFSPTPRPATVKSIRWLLPSLT
jgi:hypothetical protein